MTVTASPGFCEWLHSTGSSLAITTSVCNKLLLIGTKSSDELSIIDRKLVGCYGIESVGQSLYVASNRRVVRFEPTRLVNPQYVKFDVVYVPRITWHIGAITAHDIGVRYDGVVVLANTDYSCLCTIGDSEANEPFWMPPFISNLAPGDRCHLNGIAMENGEARYVTALGATNTQRGWSRHKKDGGIVIDVETDAIICDGLCVPHSPRVHGGELYICNSGDGSVGKVSDEQYHPIIGGLLGLTRGMTFLGDRMLVGVSASRNFLSKFWGLPLHDRVRNSEEIAASKLLVVDHSTGTIEHWLEFGDDIREVYDIACIVNTKSASMVDWV